jgi:peptide deformylase
MMLRMYVYLELGLKCRNGIRLKGRLTGLDAAFARYFQHTTDSLEAERYVGSVKKVRQELSRRLKKVEEELSAND